MNTDRGSYSPSSYQSKILKALKQLKKLQDSPSPITEHLNKYLEAVDETATTLASSCYSLGELSDGATIKMDKLRKEWVTTVETTIKAHLKILKYKVGYSSVSAVAGSDRIEAVRVDF